MLFPTYFPWFISPIKWKNPPNLVDSHLVKLLEKCGVDQPSSVSLHAASAGACPTRRLGVERGPCEGNATLHGTRGGDAPWQGPARQGNSQQRDAYSRRTCADNIESWVYQWTAGVDSNSGLLYTWQFTGFVTPQSQNADLSGPWVRPKYIFTWTTWVCF